MESISYLSRQHCFPQENRTSCYNRKESEDWKDLSSESYKHSNAHAGASCSQRSASENEQEQRKEVCSSAETEQSSDESLLREKLQFLRKLLPLLRNSPQPISMRNVTCQQGDAIVQPTHIRRMQHCYWAPEIFRAEKGAEEKSFVYTFGVFIIHFLTEELPFSNYDYPQLLYNVGMGNLLHEVPADCPLQLESIIRDCCSFNAEKRPTFKELCERYSTALEIEV
ncbi:hypothetical protein PFISCL1PPCAC_7419 [Pristionchus fissidentatus]|uniref:Protein kinase domain-containing protein n=1 Tax=Pristionchus fissidentatus TaxID=1538716 RepID=A0AAV5VDA5_9BILA|nr:hypothetical protein PFISCL1PPCAC_7419 [Pristionchus fissidentatus]